MCSEPILAPGFGNVKREMEKPALLLLLLLGNSRVRPFSCSKLTGNHLLLSKQGLVLQIRAECCIKRLSIVLSSLRIALGTLFLQYERAINPVAAPSQAAVKEKSRLQRVDFFFPHQML